MLRVINNGNKLIDQKRNCIAGGVNYGYDNDVGSGGGGGYGVTQTSSKKRYTGDDFGDKKQEEHQIERISKRP